MHDTPFSREIIRAAGRRAVELFADNFDGPETHRVYPEATRDQMRQLFADTLGDDGVGLEQAVEDFARLVLPNAMRTQHPLYLGLINTSPLPGGVLADLLVSMLNNNAGAFHQSPAMTAAEQEVIDQLIRLFGFERAAGMFLPGGSFANLQGLLLARAAHLPRWNDQGPAAVSARPVLYTSELTHFSVARAAQVAGFGRQSVVALPTSGRGAMVVSALAERIKADRDAGAQPIAVVATAGTTGTGAFDPIDKLAALCKQERLWLHVDACYGGAMLLLKDRPPAFDAIREADSVAVDPHKWFYMPMTAAVVLSPHVELQTSTFDVAASYIPGDGEIDPWRRGMPTSRRCSGFMMWMAIRAHGWNTIRDSVRRNIDLTKQLEAMLAERGFRVLPDGELSIACARWEPASVAPEKLDDLQREITREVVARGTAWFATVEHAGQTWLRFNVLNLHTRERHIQKLVDVLTSVARARE